MNWVQYIDIQFEPVRKKADAVFIEIAGDDLLGQADLEEYPNAPDELPLDGADVKDLETFEIIKKY